VYFYPDNGYEPPKNADPLFYAVNETVFRTKMTAWGIELDEK
jgi:hypothetical protein